VISTVATELEGLRNILTNKQKEMYDIDQLVNQMRTKLQQVAQLLVYLVSSCRIICYVIQLALCCSEVILYCSFIYFVYMQYLTHRFRCCVILVLHKLLFFY